MFLWRRINSINFLLHKELHTSQCLQDAIVIDGKKIADEITGELKITVDTLLNAGKKRPKLVAILVGDHPASKAYVSRKLKIASAIGIESHCIPMEENITEHDLIEKINNLNEDISVDGILVQLPLPQNINERRICQTILPKKDVDGFHLENLGNLALNCNAIVPATVLAVKELIFRSKIETFGKNAVVIGRSKHVGLPIALLLHADGTGETNSLDMTTTICHRYTPHTELKKFTKLADLVVAAAGVPNLITADMIKPGACVIDVGITRVKHNCRYCLKGDVDYENVKSIAGYITPVPGGVGPMTVAMLMKNTLLAATKNEAKIPNVYFDTIKQQIS